jgi:hypothetical protein
LPVVGSFPVSGGLMATVERGQHGYGAYPQRALRLLRPRARSH